MLRITAYLAWSLENTGYQGPAVEKAKQFVENHMSAKMDAYTLAVVANFAADYRQRTANSRARPCSFCSMRAPKKMSKPGGMRKKPASMPRGASASVETTGLAVQALLKWGEARARRARP